jgi:hypothetical protein
MEVVVEGVLGVGLLGLVRNNLESMPRCDVIVIV